MLRKTISVLLALAMVSALTACAGGDGSSESTPAGADPSSAASAGGASEAEDKTYGKLTISGVTGDPDAFIVAGVEKLQAEHPEIEVEYIPCDNSTREQVIKTAISAGDPPTIGYYWGTRVNSFYDIGMNLDLKGKISEEIVSNVNEGMLEPCLGENGEIYALPMKTVYHTTFYNKTMFDEYGFEEPETWDEMTAIFETLKADDIFGFSTNSATMQDCLYGMTYGELDAKVGEGTAYGVADGTVSVLPGTEAGEVIRGCIEQVQAWYEAGYWYPGDGGINVTQDDANAAFSQGRAACTFIYSGALEVLKNSCDFDIGTFMKPTSEAGITSIDNIEPDVFFIPSNASEEQINTGLAFLEIILGHEIQQTIVDSGQTPSMTSYTFENVDPLLEEVMAELDSGRLQAGVNPCRTSSEMQNFIKQQIFAAPCSGTMTIDQTLEEMERIRLAAGEAQ